MKVGPRNAMVIAVCSLAVVADRERGELRAAFGSSAPTARLVTSPLDEADGVPGARRRRGEPDRRRPRHGCVSPPRPPRAHPAGARAVPRMRVELTVNGEPREADVWAGESLLTTLRDRLELPGSKNACEQGECGSCSVLLDGELVCSCLVLAAQADGHDVVTVEGLGGDERAPSRAGGVRGRRRRAVRLLHARLRRRGGRSPAPRPRSDGRRDPRGALGQPLPLHRVPEDPRRRARRRPVDEHGDAARSRRGRAETTRRRADAVPKVTGEFAYSSDLQAAGMLWGQTVRSPHAHARILEIDVVRGARHAGRARCAHARGRPRAEDVRARVRRPAGARDRPRALLRRGGGDRRGRGAGAGAPRGRGGPRRVRAARAGHRSRARDGDGAAPSRPADDGARLPRRPAAERRALDGDPPRRSRRGGRRHASRASTTSASRIRRSSAPSPGIAIPDGEGGVDIHVATQWLHVDRDQVAPCLDLEPEQVRIHLAGVGGAFGGREDLSMQIHAAMLALRTEPAGEDRLQPRGVVRRPHPPPSGADLGRAPGDARRAARRRAHADPDRRRRLRLELDRGHLERLLVRRRPVRGRQRR